MTQSYKTYSVRIPSGPVSDFVDASGNGVYLRKLFYQSLGLSEAQKFREFLHSKNGSGGNCFEELTRYAYSEVFTKELPKCIRKNRKILILCEGETEAYYFKEFVVSAHATSRIKVKKGDYTDPLYLVIEAEKHLFYDQSHDRELLEVWVVFDRDRHASYRAAFEEASKYPQIKIAWTNPCFEFWFLLHCEEIKPNSFCKTLKLRNPQTNKRERLYDNNIFLNKLLEHFPGYRKADKLIFHIFRSRTLLARTRSTFNQANPHALGSSVGLLIQRLCSFLVIRKNFWDKEDELLVFTKKMQDKK